MNFEGLDALTGRHVSENLAAPTKHAGGVRLMPDLTLKHIIPQRYYATP